MTDLKSRITQGLKDKLPAGTLDKLQAAFAKKPKASRVEPAELDVESATANVADATTPKAKRPSLADAWAGARAAMANMGKGRAGKTGPSVSRRPPVSGSIRFVVQPDGARETVWELDRQNMVTRVGDPVIDETLISFSNQDYRFATLKSVSHVKAMSMALENLGQAVRIASRVSDLRVFYARPIDNMPEYEVIPGMQAIDQALAMDKDRTSYPLIAGFQLGLPDQSQVVILYHYDDAGEVGRTQVSMNPESVDFVLAQFAATRRIDLAATPVRIYDSEVFRRAISGLVAFQDEDPIMGMTPANFYARANRIALWATVFTVSACGLYYTKVENAETSAAEATESAKRVVSEKENLLASSPSSLGAQFALDGLGALKAAEQVYRPGFNIGVETPPGASAIELTISANLPSTLVSEDRAALLTAIKELPAVANCKKSEYQLTSNLNEAKVIYKCDSKASNLSEHRPK